MLPLLLAFLCLCFSLELAAQAGCAADEPGISIGSTS